MEPTLGLFLVIFSYPTVVVGMRFCYRFLTLSVEAERKLMHVVVGTYFLLLPWLFHSLWPAILLLSASILGPFAVDKINWSRKIFGRVLEVKRKNIGGPAFGLGCLLLFLLARNNNALYLASMSVLVFADAAAAVVGKKFSVLPYSIFGFKKTVIGSTVFFIVACIAIYLPLFFSNHFDLSALLLISLIVSASTTFVEAISPFGLDNLFIPMTVFFLLKCFY